MPGIFPLASGGIHAAQMHRLLDYLVEECESDEKQGSDEKPKPPDAGPGMRQDLEGDG